MTVGKIAGLSVVGLAVLAAVILGGWQAGWWFKEQNTNRHAKVLRHSYAYQQTLREEVTRKIADYQQVHTTNPGSPWERAILDIVCRDAEQIKGDPLPLDQQTFVDANCQFGAAR